MFNLSLPLNTVFAEAAGGAVFLSLPKGRLKSDPLHAHSARWNTEAPIYSIGSPYIVTDCTMGEKKKENQLA